MKLDEVCSNSKANDEYYTPAYAIYPILPYLTGGATIWCPFDTDRSLYVKILKAKGFNVINTHLSNGQDFFNMEVPDCDYIISNPPYSLKNEVFQRLYEIGKPFAMLVGVVGIFESQLRFNLFRNNPLEVLYFNKRVKYMRSYDEVKPSSNPPYSSVYICSKLLPKQLVFVELNTIDTGLFE